MKETWSRHVLLTREERWLVIGILLIALVGLAVRYAAHRASAPPSEPPPASATP